MAKHSRRKGPRKRRLWLWNIGDPLNPHTVGPKGKSVQRKAEKGSIRKVGL